jgi:hypothetical protein
MTQIEYKVTDKITQDVIKEVLHIEQNQGLTAENIIEVAKNNKSSLHDLFDWDDTEAARKWRLQQARVFINEIQVIIEGNTSPAFEMITTIIEQDKDGNVESERFYKPKLEILSNEQMRRQIIQRALRMQEYWSQQYFSYSELKPIIVSVEKVKKILNRKWQKQKV